MVKAITVAEVPVTVAVCPPEEVTVYPVMSEPPLLVGAVQVTVACLLPGVALTRVGAPGTVVGVIALGVIVFEADEVPVALVAVTVNV